MTSWSTQPRSLKFCSPGWQPNAEISDSIGEGLCLTECSAKLFNLIFCSVSNIAVPTAFFCNSQEAGIMNLIALNLMLFHSPVLITSLVPDSESPSSLESSSALLRKLAVFALAVFTKKILVSSFTAFDDAWHEHRRFDAQFLVIASGFACWDHLSGLWGPSTLSARYSERIQFESFHRQRAALVFGWSRSSVDWGSCCQKFCGPLIASRNFRSFFEWRR